MNNKGLVPVIAAIFIGFAALFAGIIGNHTVEHRCDKTNCDKK